MSTPTCVVCLYATASELTMADQRLVCLDTYQTVVNGAYTKSVYRKRHNIASSRINTAQNIFASHIWCATSTQSTWAILDWLEQARPYVTLLVALPLPATHMLQMYIHKLRLCKKGLICLATHHQSIGHWSVYDAHQSLKW